MIPRMAIAAALQKVGINYMLAPLNVVDGFGISCGMNVHSNNNLFG